MERLVLWLAGHGLAGHGLPVGRRTIRDPFKKKTPYCVNRVKEERTCGAVSWTLSSYILAGAARTSASQDVLPDNTGHALPRLQHGIPQSNTASHTCRLCTPTKKHRQKEKKMNSRGLY